MDFLADLFLSDDLMHPFISEPDDDPPPGAKARLRVLVADDEAMIRRAIRRLLERRGHAVDEADAAAGALARVGERDYDVVVLDARMPGNGLGLLETLIRDDFFGRIILMTGALPEEVAPNAPERVILLQKPFDFDEFVRLVEEGKDPGS